MTTAKIVIAASDATGPAFASVGARLQSLATSSSAFANKFAAIGGAFAALAAGGALGSFFRSTVEGIDKLNDLADATGASVENLSALEDTAARTGTSLDTVGSALVKLNKTIADAKPGTDAAAALNAIGLSAKQLQDLDPAEALLRVAQGLARFADDGNKARLTQELFGKSLKEVAPLLKDLTEKGQLNATVTTEQAQAAEKFRQNSAALAKDLTDLARTITGPVLEALNAFSARAKKEGFWSALFTETDEEQAARAAKARGIRIARLQKEIAEALAKGDRDLADKLSGKLFLQQGAQQFAEGAKKSARDILRGIEAASATRESAPVIDGVGAAEVAKRFEAYLAKLNDGIRATVELTDAEKLELAIAEKSSELRGFSAQQLDVLIGKTRALDEVTGKAAAARLRRDQQNQNIGDEGASQNVLVNVAGLASQSKASQIERVAAAIANVRDQMSAGGGDAETFRRALAVLGEQMKSLEDNSQALGEKLNQFSVEAAGVAQDIEGAFGSSLLAVMEGNAKSIVQIWTDTINRMVAQALSAKLMEKLLGTNSRNGEFGGVLGNFFNGLFASGGGTDARSINSGKDSAGVNAASLVSLFAGMFADGGHIPAGKWGIAGERGPEPVFGGRAGATVFPSSGGRSSTYVFNAAPGGSRMSQQQQAQDFFRLGAQAAGRNG